MVADMLPGWTVPAVTSTAHIRKYSTTADILSFQRCRRQYSFFGVRGFSSATATQRYFGLLVHDVLDRVTREHPVQQTLPDQASVQQLVAEAHERLIRSGVRPYNAQAQQEYAGKLIYRFVALIGPHFFPNIQHTEYRLERALTTPAGRPYVLDGVVDVLSGAVSHSLGLSISTAADDIEIWDYKSGKMPVKGSAELRSYEYQMRVYAELYRQQNDAFPARCVLAFVGELANDTAWVAPQLELQRFPRLIYTIHPHPSQIGAAMLDFHRTVEAIEAERAKPYVEQWQAPAAPPGKETCDACDLRFNCSGFPDGRKLREEAL